MSRVVAILETVAQRGPLRTHELAAGLDAPMSSVFGLVKGLQATGYLTEEAGDYRLGPAVSSLLKMAKGPDLAAASLPTIGALRDEFNETVMVGVNIGESLVYIASESSTHAIRYSAPLQMRRPLYPPSAGKIILSSWSVGRQKAYLNRHIEAEMVSGALADLATVQREGVAFNRGETLPDVSATARAICSDGALLGAVAVSGPTTRIAPRLDVIAEALGAAVSEIAARI